MIAILNTSIVTSYGAYVYSAVSLDAARDLVGAGFVSAVGHKATAEILTELLGVTVPMNRIEYAQAINDCALVFKLNGRPPEGAVLTRKQIDSIGYRFGLLTRTA